LGPQPVTSNVRQKLLSYYALGAEMRFHKSVFATGLDMGYFFIKSLFSKNRLYFISPGGSSHWGELGYINAYLELTEQLVGQKPVDRIVVPVGSMGTAAGLMVGSCIAQTWDKTQIVGVGVSLAALSNEKATRKEARKLEQFVRNKLSSSDQEKFKPCDYDSPTGFRFIDNYLAPGYGAAEPRVYETIQKLKDLESITLDPTYSAKAMQFVLDDFLDYYRRGVQPPLTLFWLTYNSHDLNEIIDQHPWRNPNQKWKDLPQDFWGLFLSPNVARGE
jgi:D-cysteine desulfhydrase